MLTEDLNAARAAGKAARFVERLAALSLPDVFNPWRDVCPTADLADAPAIRRRNLRLVLAAALASGADELWVARDLGYLGGRRTGLAMTDEPRLEAQARMWKIGPLSRATHGPAVSEGTAKEVWIWLEACKRRVFLWNVFPWHPHEPGVSSSNRLHSRRERDSGVEFLHWLCKELSPKRVVAIGRDAAKCLTALGTEHEPVRHPARGGLPDFREGMGRLRKMR
jgi:hypothetical protein